MWRTSRPSFCSGYCEQYRKRPAEQCGQAAGVQEAEKKPSRTILAYPRSNGEFGISNYLMVFPTFLGANPMAEAVAKRTGACGWSATSGNWSRTEFQSLPS